MSDNVLSSFTPTRREERAYDHTFRVGIIGTGWIAEAHAESYLNQPDVKIVALADLIPGKAEAFAKRYGLTGARCYPDHKSLLASERLGRRIRLHLQHRRTPNAPSTRWPPA